MQKEGIVERFTRYVKYDTQSDDRSDTSPTTEKQKVLSNVLAEELRQFNCEEVKVTSSGNVFATIPQNCDGKTNLQGVGRMQYTDSHAGEIPVIGFVAHIDTSPESPGGPVNPIVREYQGGDIEIGDGVVLKENEDLLGYKGKSIITSDGTTLLGGDDKAGIAIIMSVVQYLKDNNDRIRHGAIKIAFTVDEEVGGVAKTDFDVRKFGAKCAYTVDGGRYGEINNETFNAAKAEVSITGFAVHPGEAYGKYVSKPSLQIETNAVNQ